MEKLQKVFGGRLLDAGFPLPIGIWPVSRKQRQPLWASLPRNLNTFKVETKRADKAFPSPHWRVENAMEVHFLYWAQFPHLKVVSISPVYLC